MGIKTTYSILIRKGFNTPIMRHNETLLKEV